MYQDSTYLKTSSGIQHSELEESLNFIASGYVFIQFESCISMCSLIY